MKSILKLIFICTVLFQYKNLQSQTGINCSNAISVNSFSTCNYLNYSTTTSEMWFRFTAQSKDINISVNTQKFGIDIAHIHNITLYSGNCANLNFITDDELPFDFNAKELNIDMNASGLIIGNVYYIKLNRKALHDDCDKANCKLSNSTTPAYFSMCIENIDVIVPPDFGIEKPCISHAYEQNKGQLLDDKGYAVPSVKMYSQSSNPQIYIGDNFTSFVMSKIDSIPSTKDTMQRVDMTLVGANSNTRVFKTEQTAGVSNYYLPHIPNGIANIKSFSRSVLNEVYPKIDLQHYSNSDGMKFYFVIRPGGDSKLIKLKFDGASSTSTTTTGGLNIKTALGDITFEKAHVYRINPANNIVPMNTSGNFIKTGVNEYQIDVQNYPPNMPVIIQIDRGHKLPAVATTTNPVWCTHYGSSGYDQVKKIDADNNGNLYVTGMTDNVAFPHTVNMLAVNSAWNECFLMKFSPFGTPVWRIIYGGNSVEQGYNLKVDDNNNSVYMVGFCNPPVVGQASNIPLQNPGNGAYFQTSAVPNGNNGPLVYGLITKFNALTGSRIWATLYGATTDPSETYINTIDVASNGDVYIGGTTINTGGFPIVTPTGTCTPHSQNLTGVGTGFLAKFNSNNQHVWSSTFGCDGTEILDLKVSSQNEVFITGISRGSNTAAFPLKREFSNDVMNSYSGGTSDAFVSKFNECLELKWSTFFGGAGADKSNAIEISVGSFAPAKTQSVNPTYVYICGQTSSDNLLFPIKDNLNSNSLNDNSVSGTDGFIASFNHINELHWSTYVGGTNSDALNDMEFGKGGHLFIVGESKSTNFLNVPFTGAYNQTLLENTTGGNDYDAVVMALDGTTNFTKRWSTYFGGNTTYNNYRSDDYGYGITASNNYLYIGGLTWSYNNFPWNADLATYPNAYYQPNLAGTFSQDGFLAQIDLTQTIISVEEIEKMDENGFVVYPNPSTGLVYILFDDKKIKTDKLNIQVFDIQGKEVITQKNVLKSERNTLDLSHLKSGIYFIKLFGENLNKSQKIIISN